MKVKTFLPVEVDIDYTDAINVLRSKAVDITERDWYGLSYSEVDHKVYHENELLEHLTEEEHEFVGAIIKLVQAKNSYENPLVF